MKVNFCFETKATAILFHWFIYCHSQFSLDHGDCRQQHRTPQN